MLYFLSSTNWDVISHDFQPFFQTDWQYGAAHKALCHCRPRLVHLHGSAWCRKGSTYSRLHHISSKKICSLAVFSKSSCTASEWEVAYALAHWQFRSVYNNPIHSTGYSTDWLIFLMKYTAFYICLICITLAIKFFFLWLTVLLNRV